MKIAIFALILLILAGACRNQQTTGKQDLKVLFVGDDPSREVPPRNFVNGAGIAESRYAADVETRMPAFMELLRENFAEVKGVDARDYKESMTKGYDVVIFDAVPKPVVPGVKTPKKQEIDMSLLSEKMRQKMMNVVDTKEVMSARYFSEGYDKPTLFIGDRAGIMGSALGLKLNWYCRCLDAHAYDLEQEHPIFHKPLAVDLKYEERLAPKGTVSGVDGVSTPGVLPMWRVQTEGYREGGRERYRQGLVSMGEGFTDSPDAERIAGGVSDKVRSAVSIARHGNFLMWGFAASPDYMTEPAQRAFVNAVCYISGFRGQRPVSHTANGWVSRERMRDRLKVFDEETYRDYVKNVQDYNTKLTALKQEVEALKAAGEAVPGDLIAQAWPTPRKVLDREALLKSFFEYDLKTAGSRTVEEYRDYLKENMDYFYGGNGDFTFTVDEDLKSLGIAMGDPKLLERAIGLLEGSAGEREKGMRLLQRYTFKNYTSAAEWRQWLAGAKEHLFFSETGGYKFYENGATSSPVQASVAVNTGGVMQDNPVTVTAAADKAEIVIRFTIRPGFHIYAASGDAGAYTLTKVDFAFPQGIRPKGALVCPEGKVYEADPKVRIYEGMVEFRQPLTVEKEGKVTCTVTYQACDATICLPPVTENLEVKSKK